MDRGQSYVKGSNTIGLVVLKLFGLLDLFPAPFSSQTFFLDVQQFLSLFFLLLANLLQFEFSFACTLKSNGWPHEVDTGMLSYENRVGPMPCDLG